MFDITQLVEELTKKGVDCTSPQENNKKAPLIWVRDNWRRCPDFNESYFGNISDKSKSLSCFDRETVCYAVDDVQFKKTAKGTFYVMYLQTVIDTKKVPTIAAVMADSRTAKLIETNSGYTRNTYGVSFFVAKDEMYSDEREAKDMQYTKEELQKMLKDSEETLIRVRHSARTMVNNDKLLKKYVASHKSPAKK